MEISIQPLYSMKHITVLISGSGSNLQALIDNQTEGKLGGKITQVISSNAQAFGLTRASNASIPSKTHILKEYYKGIPKENTAARKEKRELFNSHLANLLISGSTDGTAVTGYVRPDLIVCAGWMLILSPSVLTPLEKAGIVIINLHPALPGAFEGTHAIDRAWQAGQDGEITKGGVMIHKVITEVDKGEPILVKEIELLKGDSLEDYEQKVHDVEHVAIVEGTNRILGEIPEVKEVKVETKEEKLEPKETEKLESKETEKDETKETEKVESNEDVLKTAPKDASEVLSSVIKDLSIGN